MRLLAASISRQAMGRLIICRTQVSLIPPQKSMGFMYSRIENAHECRKRRGNYSAAVSVRPDGATKPPADGEEGLLNSITPPPPPHGTKSAEDMRRTDRVTMWGPKTLGSREVLYKSGYRAVPSIWALKISSNFIFELHYSITPKFKTCANIYA